MVLEGVVSIPGTIGGRAAPGCIGHGRRWCWCASGTATTSPRASTIRILSGLRSGRRRVSGFARGARGDWRCSITPRRTRRCCGLFACIRTQMWTRPGSAPWWRRPANGTGTGTGGCERLPARGGAGAGAREHQGAGFGDRRGADWCRTQRVAHGSAVAGRVLDSRLGGLPVRSGRSGRVRLVCDAGVAGVQPRRATGGRRSRGTGSRRSCGRAGRTRTVGRHRRLRSPRSTRLLR